MNYACFKDQVFILTGGAGGCGRGTAFELIRHGACVSLIDVNAEGLKQVAQRCIELGASHDKLLTYVGNTTDEDTCKNFVEATVNKFGKINGLYNIVGRKIAGNLHTAKWSYFEDTYKAFIKSAFTLSQLCLPYLKETKGCILNMSGTAGVKPCYHNLAYGVFMAAMDRFTEACAAELSSCGIRVNGISPVALQNDSFQKSSKPMTDQDLQNYYQFIREVVPLGEVATCEHDVAQASLFLLSDQSTYTTGFILPITGAYEHTITI